jgi:hypothetical protein
MLMHSAKAQKKSTETWLTDIKEVGLEVTETKTDYRLLSGHNKKITNKLVADMAKFKWTGLETSVKTGNCVYEETNYR